MAKRLCCNDVFEGCFFEATGESEAEVLQKAAAHATGAHGVTEIDMEMTEKIRRAIRDV